MQHVCVFGVYSSYPHVLRLVSLAGRLFVSCRFRPLVVSCRPELGVGSCCSELFVLFFRCIVPFLHVCVIGSYRFNSFSFFEKHNACAETEVKEIKLGII